jgi:hypothetical protein
LPFEKLPFGTLPFGMLPRSGMPDQEFWYGMAYSMAYRSVSALLQLCCMLVTLN